ncbi:MAG TPA: diacylglycerol kinase family protein, partial [Opitutus sp.]|nr:diacylglycerol kinase family protein [Opitutus sp.]
MNAIMVLNAQAGTALKEDAPGAEELSGAFAQLGVNLAVCEVRGPDIEAALRNAVSRRPHAIFAAGGDGTISTAATH